MSETKITVGAISQKNHGIMEPEPNKTWHNMANGLDKETKDKVIGLINGLNKGDEATLVKNEQGGVIDLFVTKKAPENSQDRGSFQETLEKAHQKFGEALSIETEMVLHEGKSPVECGWLCKAKVTLSEKNKPMRVFVGYGDATNENVTGDVGKALPRMAETRAIGRALRWALAGATLEEEVK